MGPATAQGGGIRANICHSFGDPSRRRENDVDGGPRLSSVGSQTKRAVTPVSQYDFICDLGVLVCESFQKRAGLFQKRGLYPNRNAIGFECQ